jgi:hypothetical protein
MKRGLKFFPVAALFAALVANVFSACSPPNDPPVDNRKLVLTADKYALTADGVDKIDFTVKFDGEDVTTLSQVCDPDGLCLLTPVFTTTEPGQYHFYASYDPDATGNVIKSDVIVITADEAFDPAKFNPERAVKKNVAFFVWTSTYCAPCFTYKTYMKEIREGSAEDRVVEANFYTDPADCRPEVIGSPEYLRGTINQMMADGRFTLSYQPEIIIELREDLTGTSLPSETTVRAKINSFSVNNPRTAVKVASVRTDGKIEGTVTVGAREAGEYFVGLFLTEDHISGPQLGYGAGYDHTNVVREMGTENIFGESLGAMAAGDTADYEFSMPAAGHYNPENLSVVVYTMYMEDGHAVIDNSLKVTANGNSDYNYAD